MKATSQLSTTRHDVISQKTFVLWRYSPTRVRSASLPRFLDHTQLDTHTRKDSSGRVISPSHRPLPTQHTTNTRDEHPCSSGIRTRDPSHQAAVDLSLRPHGHRDRQSPKCPCFQAVKVKFSNRMRFNTFNTNSHDALLQIDTRKVTGLNLVRDDHPNFLSLFSQ